MPAALQVREGIAQAAELADPDSSFFTTFHAGRTESSALRADLQRAGLAAAESYGLLAQFLRELEADAPAADASGRERYQLLSRVFLGAEVDLDETYEWGLDELARVAAEQDAVIEALAGPGRPSTMRCGCWTATRTESSTAPRRCRNGCRPPPTRRSPT